MKNLCIIIIGMHIIAKNIEENVNASFIKSEISTETFKRCLAIVNLFQK